MPGFSGTHGNTGKQNRRQLYLENQVHLREASDRIHVKVLVFLFHVLSLWGQSGLPVPNPMPHAVHDEIPWLWVCAIYNNVGKDTKRSKKRLFVCTREQEKQMKPDWGQCDSEARRGLQPTKLVNGQTPPCSTITSFPPSPTLSSSSAVTVASTVLLTPHLWFDWNFTINTQPRPHFPQVTCSQTHGACQSNVPYNFKYITPSHHSLPCIWV